MYRVGQATLVTFLSVASWGGGAFAQATRPAASMPSESDTDLKQCMQHCRSTFTSIEQTLRLIDRAQASNDPSQARDALTRAQTQLIDMREHMSRCMMRLERIRNHAGGDSQASAIIISRVWACPMHTQVRQDRPGNCPICDATLKPIGDAPTQPAVALSPEKTDQGAVPGEKEWTAGR